MGRRVYGQMSCPAVPSITAPYLPPVCCTTACIDTGHACHTRLQNPFMQATCLRSGMQVCLKTYDLRCVPSNTLHM